MNKLYTIPLLVLFCLDHAIYLYKGGNYIPYLFHFLDKVVSAINNCVIMYLSVFSICFTSVVETIKVTMLAYINFLPHLVNKLSTTPALICGTICVAMALTTVYFIVKVIFKKI